MEELFKDIPNFEGIYQVSTLGRVKSLRFNKEKILKAGINSNGYYVVGLSKDKVKRTFKVHQLVAMTFLNHKPNGNKIVVDHIDNDKLNNNLNNLQLLTNRENCTKTNRGSSRFVGVHWSANRNKWVAQIQINGKQVRLGRFDCELEAARAYKNSLINLI